MGLFSSKKKVQVSSTTINLGGTAPRKRFISQVIQNSITNQQSYFSEDITRSLLNGAGIKLKKFYRYGRDKYTRGLPVGITTSNQIADDFFTTYLRDTILKKEITIYQNYSGLLNDNFFVNKALNEIYGFDVETYYWDKPPANMPTDADYGYEIVKIENDVLSIKLVFSKTNGVYDDPEQEEANTHVLLEVPLDLPNYTLSITSRNHLSSIYREIIDTDVEVSPTTSRLFISTDTDNTKTDSQRKISNTNVVTQVTTKTVVKVENYDPDTMDDYVFSGSKPNKGDLITSTVVTTTKQTFSDLQFFDYIVGTGTYPDLDNLYTITTTTNKSDYFPIVLFREYQVNLFDAFHTLYDPNVQSSKNLLKKVDIKVSTLLEGIYKNPDVYQVNHAYLVTGISINTKEEVCNYYLYHHFLYIYEQMQKGVIHTYTFNCICGSYRVLYGVSNIVVRNVVGVVGIVGDVYKQAGSFGNIFLRKQISKTRYTEILVSGLNYGNFIYGSKGVGYDGWQSLFRSDETVIIPLLYTVVKNMSLLKLTQMCSDAYHMVFNSYKITKVRWYEKLLNSIFFKIILVAVAIVITIFSGGFLSGLSAAMTSAAAAGTSVAYAAAAYITTTLAGTVIYGTLVSYGISYGISLVGQLTGSQLLVAIASVVAIVAAGVSFTGAFNGLLSFNDIVSVIPAVTRGISTVQNAELTSEIKSLEADYNNLTGNYGDISDKLSSMDADSFRYVPLYETPDTFFNRTLLTEPATVFLTQVDSFVNNQLFLDKQIKQL